MYDTSKLPQTTRDYTPREAKHLQNWFELAAGVNMKHWREKDTCEHFPMHRQAAGGVATHPTIDVLVTKSTMVFSSTAFAIWHISST